LQAKYLASPKLWRLQRKEFLPKGKGKIKKGKNTTPKDRSIPDNRISVIQIT